ncbi:MAG: Uncharacterised protein [Halieaceae bacterium]|nr:MAG: Uncharacterised protein [Halieaceae bacterium]
MLGHAIIEIFQRLIDNGSLTDIIEIHACFSDDGADALYIEWFEIAIWTYNVDRSGSGFSFW